MRLLATLRARVIALAVGVAALVIVLAALPIAVLLRSSAYGDAEHHATDAAQSAADYLSTGDVDDQLLKAYLTRLNQRGDTPVTVLTSDGDVLGAGLAEDVLRQVRQHPQPDMPNPDHDQDNLGQVSTAHTIDVHGGRVVQVLAQNGQGVAQVLASVTDDSVADTVRDRYLLVGGSALLLVALAWIAADLTARRLVRPLQRTADTAVSILPCPEKMITGRSGSRSLMASSTSRPSMGLPCSQTSSKTSDGRRSSIAASALVLSPAVRHS